MRLIYKWTEKLPQLPPKKSKQKTSKLFAALENYLMCVAAFLRIFFDEKRKKRSCNVDKCLTAFLCS